MDVMHNAVIELTAMSKGVNDSELGPEELSVIGALGCFEQKSPAEIWVDLKGMNQEEKQKKIEAVFEETSGRGHGSVLDQNGFWFSMANVSRLFTIFDCSPEYLAHLQQSLRRASADRGFVLSNAILKSSLKDRTQRVLEESFDIYSSLEKRRVPAEDARYVLPLFTRTNIQTGGNSRELMHLHDMSRRMHTPSDVSFCVEKMMVELKKVAPKLFKERANNYNMLAWRPSLEFYAPENPTIADLVAQNGENPVTLIGNLNVPMSEAAIIKAVKEKYEPELANLKHNHFEFLVSMSIASLHQAIRQRTWHQSVETIYDAISRGEFVIPPSIERIPEALADYGYINESMITLFHDLVSEGVPRQDAIGVMPHSLKVYDWIHCDGWNAVHSLAKRTCKTAQWEIRNNAKAMADLIREVNPVLGQFAVPQGMLYGTCPERENCGYCAKKGI